MNERDEALSLIVKTVARVVARLMLLFGMYVVLHGQVTHGGGFAGGVVMALVFILIMLAYGGKVAAQTISKWAAVLMAGAGLVLLLVIGFTGYERGHFFENVLGHGWPFEFWSAGVIPFLNVAIGLVVVGSLYGIFVALSAFRSGENSKE